MIPSLSLQKALRAVLTGSAEVTALVSPESIVDRHGPPQAFPCIILGEDLETASDLTFDRRHVTVYATLHIFSREPGLTQAKEIAAAIRHSVNTGLALEGGRMVDFRFESARFLRDPDGQTAHGVVTLEATIEEGF